MLIRDAVMGYDAVSLICTLVVENQATQPRDSDVADWATQLGTHPPPLSRAALVPSWSLEREAPVILNETVWNRFSISSVAYGLNIVWKSEDVVARSLSAVGDRRKVVSA